MSFLFREELPDSQWFQALVSARDRIAEKNGTFEKKAIHIDFHGMSNENGNDVIFGLGAMYKIHTKVAEKLRAALIMSFVGKLPSVKFDVQSSGPMI